MQTDLRDDLPLVQRLALSYAPASSREAILTLLALDTRLATILRNRSEAIIAQIKLAWWRERLSEDPALWPSGEPLLERLALWPADRATLVELVNGWEALLAGQLDEAVMREFAAGRAAAWGGLAASIAPKYGDQTARAAMEWALADLAMHLDNSGESALARELAEGDSGGKSKGGGKTASLPKSLRPLAVLHGLSRRALDKNSSEMLDNMGGAMLALRIGLIGR